MKWHVEKVNFSTDTVELYGEILIPNGEGPFPGVVLCHGMASDSRSMRPTAQRIVRHDIAALTFDFRGHGRSTGVLNNNIDQDAAAALNLLRQHVRIDPKRIALVGHSMGAIAALCAATTVKDIKALVFLSVPAEIDGFMEFWAPLRTKAKRTGIHIIEFPSSGPFPMLGWFNGLTSRLWMWLRNYRLRIKLEQKVDSWSNLNPLTNIQKIGNFPKLFVHCKGDKWVPYQKTLSLYDKAEQPKELILTDGGFHVSPLLPGKLRRQWINWLVSTLK